MLLSNPMIGPHGIPEAQNKERKFDPRKNPKFSGNKNARFQPFGGMEDISPVSAENISSVISPASILSPTGPAYVIDYSKRPRPELPSVRNPMFPNLPGNMPFGGAIDQRLPIGIRSKLGSSKQDRTVRPSVPANPWDWLLEEAGKWDYNSKPALGNNPWGGAGTFDNAWFRWGPIAGIGPEGFFDQIAAQTRDSLWDAHARLPKDIQGIMNPDQAAITYWKNRPFNYSNISMNPAGMAQDIMKQYLNQPEFTKLRGKEWTPPDTQEYKDWINQVGQATTSTAMNYSNFSKKESALKKFGPMLLSLALSFIPGMQTLAGTIGQTVASGASAATQQLLGNIIMGAGSGGISSAAGGGDIFKGMLTGGLGAGIGTGLGNITGSKLLGNVGGSLTKSLASGGKFGDSLLMALAGGVLPEGLGELGGNISPGLGDMARSFSKIALPQVVKEQIMNKKFEDMRNELAMRDFARKSQRSQRSVA